MHEHDDEHLLHEPLLGVANSDDAKSRDNRQHLSQKQPMAVMEQLMLSPYEKWLAHGRFPYKIVLHVLLIALTCTQMGIYDAQNAAYMRATHRNWCVLLTSVSELTAAAADIILTRCFLRHHGDRAYFFLPPGSGIGVVYVTCVSIGSHIHGNPATHCSFSCLPALS